MGEPAAIAARIRRWEEEGPQGPVTLELYPTLKCNLDCVFCDTTDRHQGRQNELPLQRHLEILDEARELGVERVFVLGGGEPLVARDLTPPILHRVKELGMEHAKPLATPGAREDAAKAGPPTLSRTATAKPI